MQYPGSEQGQGPFHRNGKWGGFTWVIASVWKGYENIHSRCIEGSQVEHPIVTIWSCGAHHSQVKSVPCLCRAFCCQSHMGNAWLAKALPKDGAIGWSIAQRWGYRVEHCPKMGLSGGALPKDGAIGWQDTSLTSLRKSISFAWLGVCSLSVPAAWLMRSSITAAAKLWWLRSNWPTAHFRGHAYKYTSLPKLRDLQWRCMNIFKYSKMEFQIKL